MSLETAEEPDEPLQRSLFVERHFCRVVPMSEELVRTYELIGSNMTVYVAMMGNPESEVTGTLRDWTSVPRLADHIPGAGGTSPSATP